MRPAQTRRRAVALLTLGLAGRAWPHTGQPHDKTGPVRQEQKAWGVAGEARSVRRTVEIRMSDRMRFTPDHLDLRQGETVRLIIRNDGALLHEFVLGTKPELDAHAALMARFPDMEHDEPYMAHVPPGQSGQVVWTFNRAGDFHFACLVAGHHSAGMVGTVTVRSAAAGPASR